jgi:hypothetical protein
MNAMKMNAMKLAIPLFVALAYGPSPALAVPILGPNLATFAVLGAESVTNVTPSTIVGNVGVSPGVSITGFNSTPLTAVSDPQVTLGLVHATTAIAASAQAELTTARLNLALLGPGTLLPVDLTGLTIFPGVFTVPGGTTNLSGAVTLNGLGDANAFWLFQTDAFTTSSGSVVNVINTGTGAGVFWNDVSSVTLASSTSFQGNILALTSIGLVTTAKIGCGRALADTASVTLQQNTIGIGCGPGSGGVAGSNGFSGSVSGSGGLEFVPAGIAGPGPGGTILSVATVQVAAGPGAGTVVSRPGNSVPEPGTLVLFGLGLVGLFAFRKRLFPVA